MNTFHGKAKDFSSSLQLSVAQYRHAIFIERLGWDLPVENGKELDQFDGDDTAYVIAKNSLGEITGCARLLPTTSPYLLGDVFPQLMNGLPIPHQSDVWELSRFASADVNNPEKQRSRSDEVYHARALLAASIQSAASYGAKRLITVSPLGVERLLLRVGVNAHRAGPPVMVDGKPIFACWIEIDEQTCGALGIKPGETPQSVN